MRYLTRGYEGVMAVEEKILIKLKKQFPGNFLELPEKFKATDKNGRTAWKYYKNGSNFLYSDKLQYYYETYSENLFKGTLVNHRAEFERAAGHEIECNGYGVQKMAAIKSSSALLFNTLGDDKYVAIKGPVLPNGNFHLKYEEPLPAIDPRYPAYIDGFLKDENGMFIFIESKMLEYLNLPRKLKKAYLDCEQYQLWKIDPYAAKSFQKLFEQSCCDKSLSKNGEYKSVIPAYDIFQILIHSMAILTFLLKLKDNVKEVFLVNTVWNIPEKSTDFLGEDKEEYLGKWENVVTGVGHLQEYYLPEIQEIYKSALGNEVIFSFCFLKWSDFKEMVEMDIERKEYLKKYEL
ncbi:MAG: hypothetical protein GX754_03775 [Clostridiaceae bacterium]|nr:hypothetical protein [Clostridiaceae bacterium]